MLPRRHFNESAAAALRRSEVDPATRHRVTFAHEHLMAAHGVSGIHRKAARWTPDHVHRAGLTMGEAIAGGL